MTTTDRGARVRAVQAAGAAAALLALPAAAAADLPDPPSPRETALRAPIAGHVTVAGQMRAARRSDEQKRLIRARVSRLRRDLHDARRERVAVPAALEAIAACESGGDPGAIGGGGLYRGKYQFDVGTWASVGGSGDPAEAPEAEQDMRAAQLYARAGTTPWPVCGG